MRLLVVVLSLPVLVATSVAQGLDSNEQKEPAEACTALVAQPVADAARPTRKSESLCRPLVLSDSRIVANLPFSIDLESSDLGVNDQVRFDDGTKLEIEHRRSGSFQISGTSKSAPGTKVHVTLVREGKPVSQTAVIEVVARMPRSQALTQLSDFPVSDATVHSAKPAAIELPASVPARARPQRADFGGLRGDALASAIPAVANTPVAPPSISSLTSSVPGNAVATISVKGSGFQPGSRVMLGTTPLTVTTVTATNIVATGYIPLTTGNAWAVQVLNAPPSSVSSNVVALQIAPANPSLTYAAARRFLQQATWGPTPASIRHLQDVGIDTWLNEQFDSLRTPVSRYDQPQDPYTNTVPLQEAFFGMAFGGADQLRQRVAFALGQIAVVSSNKVGSYSALMPFEQMLLNDAFGKYSDFLKDVTLSPAMGVYLDMVNNDLPSSRNSPDENYAREVMQLMSIGLVQLNPDGSVSANAPATYTQDDVRALARVFTGWTYPNCLGSSQWPNGICFDGPMVSFEQHHDETPKTFLGTNIQAGSAAADLDLALQVIERVPSSNPAVPNMAPFISLRLIQHLVTSNPAPDYVARVSEVFTSTQGDLKEVVRAILEDPAAGFGNGGADLPLADGHLQEPVLYSVSLLRALDAQVVYDPPIQALTAWMGQDLFDAPSVFNYYSPFNRLPNSPVASPEYQLFTQVTALARMTYVYNLVRNAIQPTMFVDLGNLAELGSDTNPQTQVATITVMLNAVSQALLGQPMPQPMVAAIMPAMLATTNAQLRAQNAVTLVATSGLCQVQR